MTRLLLAMALGLCACATVTDTAPDIAAASAALPDTLPADVAFAPDPSRADSFAALFADPVLADHLAATLLSNRDIAAARLSAQIASQRLAQARARRLPRISVSTDAGAATFLSDIDISDSLGINAVASYDPDLFGAVRAGIRGAQARRDVAQLDADRLARVLLAQTATAYVQAIEADRQLALARENFEFLGETLRVSRARFEGGAIARADFALSEAEYENARASLVSQELSARASRRTLAALRGDFADATPRVAAALPSLVPPGLGLMSTRSLLERFDVRASAASVYAATADLDATRANTLPLAGVSAAFGGGGSIGDLFDIDTYLARLTASLSDTVFGNAEDAQIAESQLRLDAALLRYEDTLRDAYAELSAAFDRTAALERQLSALATASESAATALELETIRYDLGEAILLDVLTVQRRVNAIQSSAIRAQSLYLQAVIDAHLAGGP